MTLVTPKLKSKCISSRTKPNFKIPKSDILRI